MSGEYLQMKVLELDDDVYVTGQLFEHTLKVAAGQGIRTVINNRPDNEQLGQPLSADLASAAESLGMKFVHFPVVSGAITERDVEGFRKVLADVEKPMLIFCRSGARSTMLWQMAEAG